MTTRVAEGGGGEYGACHYTLAGGVRVPRNLYFSPFALSFHDSPPTLSSRLSLFFLVVRRLRLVPRSLRVFTDFPVFSESVLFTLRHCFFFSLHHALESTTRSQNFPSSVKSSRATAVALRFSPRDSEFPARVTRLQRRAASTTTCRHDNTKSIRSIERSLHS